MSLAAGDPKVAVAVEAAQVAGGVPAVRAGDRTTTVVRARHRLAAQLDLAVGRDSHLHAVERRARGAGFGAHQRGGRRRHLGAGLGHAVGERDGQPGRQRPLHQGGRGARSPDEHATQRPREWPGEACVEQTAQHGGHQRDVGDPARPDPLDQGVAAVGAPHHHPAAGRQSAVDQRHPADVGERKGRIPDIVRAQAQPGTHTLCACLEVGPGERDGARPPSGARRAQDGHHGVRTGLLQRLPRRGDL